MLSTEIFSFIRRHRQHLWEIKIGTGLGVIQEELYG